MVPRWRFLATFLHPAFQASRVQQVSDLHLKFALRPHHAAAERKKRRKKKNKLVDRSSPYYGDTWKRYCCLTSFFPIVDMCLGCEDIARQSCAMVPRRRFLATFLRPVFAASRVQQVSDLHSKFALRPHHVPKYGKHPISDR